MGGRSDRISLPPQRQRRNAGFRRLERILTVVAISATSALIGAGCPTGPDALSDPAIDPFAQSDGGVVAGDVIENGTGGKDEGGDSPLGDGGSLPGPGDGSGDTGGPAPDSGPLDPGGFDGGESGGDTPPTPNETAAAIQSQLDQTGYCYLPPGYHNINVPIQIRANQRLSGAGRSSVLNYIGSGNWAVIFGDPNDYMFGSWVDNLTIWHGGLRLVRFGQNCGVERVWVSSAPGDGVLFDGFGSKMVLRDLVCWGSAGHGITMRPSAALNGVLFDHCNSQANQGHGALLEAVIAGTAVNKTVFRDCTIQSNGLGGLVSAEVMMRGWVFATLFENMWIENPPGRPESLPVGLRTEAIYFSDTYIQRPMGLRISGTSSFHLMPRAIEFDPCLNCRIEQLTITDGSYIYYRAPWPPEGDLWLLPSGAVLPLP